MSLPEAPTNVRVQLHDGTEYPVEVAYRGIDENGQHLWTATTLWRGTPSGVSCDTLPPLTAISIEFVP